VTPFLPGRFRRAGSHFFKLVLHCGLQIVRYGRKTAGTSAKKSGSQCERNQADKGSLDCLHGLFLIGQIQFLPILPDPVKVVKFPCFFIEVYETTTPL
jgi:hypothetical protein